jgi:hypothetical protein
VGPCGIQLSCGTGTEIVVGETRLQHGVQHSVDLCPVQPRGTMIGRSLAINVGEARHQTVPGSGRQQQNLPSSPFSIVILESCYQQRSQARFALPRINGERPRQRRGIEIVHFLHDAHAARIEGCPNWRRATSLRPIGRCTSTSNARSSPRHHPGHAPHGRCDLRLQKVTVRVVNTSRLIGS